MSVFYVVFEQLQRHEGYRQKPYRDSVGKLTIGFGRNLDDVGISKDEANFLLRSDVFVARRQAEKFVWFASLDEPRQSVIVNMIFNLGLEKFSRFKNTIRFIEFGNYALAAKEMLNSKWASQVGNRAKELARIMETGQITDTSQQGG
ncbi:MAG: lysozyme [Candidatus Eisenbacteria bacterium]|nr:lysozyme [Candidatus Eisenbacteria bacterium]